jgi:hypothetical protein
VARRKVSYRGASVKPVKIQGQESLATDFLTFQVDRPQFSTEVEDFVTYFRTQVAVVSVALAASGVGVAKRTLLGAETPWGQARMRGEYFGTRFRPYGKGPGRFDTGNMYNALKILDTNAAVYAGSKKKGLNVDFGYDKSMDRSLRWGGPYFEAQERGFLNPWSFKADETSASGIATFGPARSPRRVAGAQALPAAAESIAKRIDSAFSNAWEEAKKRFESDGFASGNVGRYIDARDAFRANPPKRGSVGRDQFQALLPDDGSSFEGFFKLPEASSAELSRLSSAIGRIDRLYKFGGG